MHTYKTKQRSGIEELLKQHKGEHLTVDEIYALLTAQDNKVGKATVYRCLKKMIEQGVVKKYLFCGDKSARYEYQADNKSASYRLKCYHCGELTYLECDILNSLPEHIKEHHGFKLDTAQTVLMGCCEKCTKTVDG